jgi:hypothetical protein
MQLFGRRATLSAQRGLEPKRLGSISAPVVLTEWRAAHECLSNCLNLFLRLRLVNILRPAFGPWDRPCVTERGPNVGRPRS